MLLRATLGGQHWRRLRRSENAARPHLWVCRADMRQRAEALTEQTLGRQREGGGQGGRQREPVSKGPEAGAGGALGELPFSQRPHWTNRRPAATLPHVRTECEAARLLGPHVNTP